MLTICLELAWQLLLLQSVPPYDRKPCAPSRFAISSISRNLRLFWDALGVICAWVPLGLAGGVVRGVNGGRRARFENAERRRRALIAWVIAKPPQLV